MVNVTVNPNHIKSFINNISYLFVFERCSDEWLRDHELNVNLLVS